jgi:four helix bundle protein
LKVENEYFIILSHGLISSIYSEVMEEQAISISKKLEDFGASVIILCKTIGADFIDKHIALQLMRSATSVGANYEEGRVAESRNDFIHKLHIRLKECREAICWLRIGIKSNVIPVSEGAKIQQEAESIERILAKSIITAKQKKD